MKIKRAVAIMLACTLLAGQTVYAQESERKEETEGIGLEEKEAEEEYIEESTEQPDEHVESAEQFSTQNETAEIIAEENRNVYIGIPVRMEKECKDMWESTAESSDPEICEIQTISWGQNNGAYYIYFTLVGKREGVVSVTVYDEEKQVESVIPVTVKASPEDAVQFSDPMLAGYLLGYIGNTGVDENQDGYITKEELGKRTDFSFGRKYSAYESESIRDLSGMEYAVNARQIELWRNECLQDLTPLQNLDNLEEISLYDTDVSAEERWKLANVNDLNIKRGEKFVIPKIKGLLEQVEISDIENDGVIEYDRPLSSIEGVTSFQYNTVKNGTAVLEVKYGDYTKQVQVTVSGPQPEYPVGESVKGDVNLYYRKDIDGQEGLAVLKDNGELWGLTSEINKIETDVKKVTGKYVLKNNGDLIENGLNGQTVLENIKDITQLWTEDGRRGWLALQTDGTLWWNKVSYLMNEEVESGFQKLDSDVKTIAKTGYLKNNGTVIISQRANNEFIDIEEKAEYINSVGYYTESGIFHFCGDYYGRGTCNWKVKDITPDNDHHNSEMNIWYDAILTMDGEVWARESYDDWKDAVLLGRNAEKLLNDVVFKENSVDWVDKEGNYYTYNNKVEATEEFPIETMDYGSYHIEWYGEGNGEYLFKNGAKMLDYVKNILYVLLDGTAIVLRTDGSIWGVGDEPVLLMEGAVGNYKRGDVNEDGEVNIKDLQLILRGVCEKIELTERQIMIADVVEDGKVDIQDLRKELRFVCGKITEL